MSESANIDSPDSADLQHLSQQTLASLQHAQACAEQWRSETETRFQQMESELEKAREALVLSQAEAVTAHRALETTRAELAQVKLERDHYRDDCAIHVEKMAEAARHHEIQLDARETALQEHRQQLNEARAELQVKHEQLEGQIERNSDLHHELVELYTELHGDDLPSLILRIATSLTKSENGLFVEADGDGILADVSLRDLPPNVQEALFKWTRQAAEANSPVVQNEGEKLADGENLINLAALPVAVQSTLKGVILVANKRSGNYTDHDTELLLSIGRHAGVAMENRRLHVALRDSFHSTVAVLADAIEAKDAYTRGHCESVSHIAVEVAKRLGVKGNDLDQVRYAALLHDVGKIGVPDGILLKPGKLLPEEFLVIQKHATIGSDLISRVPLLAEIAPIILHHHERVDGSGYPMGLIGDGISLAARIIGVVDAFDAMTSTRPYRDPFEAHIALEELRRHAGSQFDAQVVEILCQVVGDCPSD
jgi:putative nucleotidyltransferase with HDIG domain